MASGVGTFDSNQDYTGAGGAATNASFTGTWLPLFRIAAVGFQVVMTGTGNPTGTFGLDVTDDEDPTNNPINGATPLPLTSAETSANPAGTGAAVNLLFDRSPAPTARWIRFKYTATSGGSASKLLKVGVALRRAAGGA